MRILSVAGAVGFAALVLSLGGCQNHPLDCAIGINHPDCLPDTLAGRRAEARQASDDDACQSYGLKFGTPAYAECRQRFIGQRRALAGAVMGAYISRPPPVAPQPYMMPTHPIRNTTCSTFGTNTNCTTY